MEYLIVLYNEAAENSEPCRHNEQPPADIIHGKNQFRTGPKEHSVPQRVKRWLSRAQMSSCSDRRAATVKTLAPVNIRIVMMKCFMDFILRIALPSLNDNRESAPFENYIYHNTREKQNIFSIPTKKFLTPPFFGIKIRAK